MKVIIEISLIFALALCAINGFAQNKSQPKAVARPKDTIKKVKNFLPDVYLGHSDFNGGKIRKKDFDSLMRQGLSSRDSLGNTYSVKGFDFTYAERNVYEDSLANLIVVADYLFEYCPGDTLTRGIAETFYQRTKLGDTVFFDKVKVARVRKPSNQNADTATILGKPLKCIIAK